MNLYDVHIMIVYEFAVCKDGFLFEAFLKPLFVVWIRMVLQDNGSTVAPQTWPMVRSDPPGC